MAWAFYTPSGQRKYSLPAQTIIAPTFLPGAFGGNSLGALTANQAYIVPIGNVIVPTTISRIIFRVGTQSGNMDVGVYYSDDESTFTKLFSTGSFAVPAAGVTHKSVGSQTITPVGGRRWYYAMAIDNGTATVLVANPTSGGPVGTWGGFLKATSFVLPATLTATTASTDAVNYPIIHGEI